MGGFCWLFFGCCLLLLVVFRCSWLLFVALGCCSLLLVVVCCSWLLFLGLGCCFSLLAVVGYLLAVVGYLFAVVGCFWLPLSVEPTTTLSGKDNGEERGRGWRGEGKGRGKKGPRRREMVEKKAKELNSVPVF